ncbi:MAG: MFS transporter, partial [Pseudomonadota bacterium]
TELLGQAGIARILGWMSLPYLIGFAAAPYLGALIWSIGGYGAVLTMTTGFAMGGLLALALAARLRRRRSLQP